MLELGKAIQLIRQAKGVRMSAVAKKAGIGVPFLSLIESGTRQPSLDVLRRIARALGVPSELLILLGQASDTSLQSSDVRTASLVDSVREMKRAEAALKAKLKEGQDEPKRTRPRKNRSRNGIARKQPLEGSE